MLDIQNSEQLSREIIVPGVEGQPTQHAAHMYCNYRPGKNVNISIEIINAEVVAANEADVTASVQSFLATAFERARAMGIPMPSAAPTASS